MCNHWYTSRHPPEDLEVEVKPIDTKLRQRSIAVCHSASHSLITSCSSRIGVTFFPALLLFQREWYETDLQNLVWFLAWWWWLFKFDIYRGTFYEEDRVAEKPWPKAKILHVMLWWVWQEYIFPAVNKFLKIGTTLPLSVTTSYNSIQTLLIRTQSSQ